MKPSPSTLLFLVALAGIAGATSGLGACSATNDPAGTAGSGASGTGNAGQGGGLGCPRCDLDIHVDCDGNETSCGAEDLTCDPTLGCVACAPGTTYCVGNEVHACTDQGTAEGPLVETCDVDAGLTCSDGVCKTACEIAEDQPSNVGCEFWAVDLDQQDALNDPANAPWGVALSNAGSGQANVTIEINEAPVGEPAQHTVVEQVSIDESSIVALALPTRELDCGTVPNDYASPGTCLSSRAFRITSSSPIIVYQFNVFENAYSNDASLLLPTNALGLQYRVIGWSAGHPVEVPLFEGMIDRSYVTVVGTAPDTKVTVKPSWRIRGNPPIAATPAGGEIVVTLNPFDVLNLETDDGTFQDDIATIADLSGTFVYSDKPVAVFSGVESTAAPGSVDIPTYPGWEEGDSCCLDHLEEQLFPIESIGSKYVITRSPVRSTSSYREPDVIRFVGAAEAATVTTTLPAPFDSFTLQPGEVKTTWAQNNFTVVSDKPVQVGQLLISQEYVDGPFVGDPALTLFPPVDQYRTEYVILTPGSWTQSWVVISAEVGSTVTIDGATPAGCIVEPAGTVDDVTFESRRCPLQVGVHALTGDKPFGVTGYGYGSAGSYAFAGGADVEKIYVPPVPK
jgi:hypothetical protein